MFDFSLMSIIGGLPGLLIALVVHEYAHARVADAMGDFTPRMMGRLTLNPKAHIDPIGLVMLLIAHFGWAKPVMYNARNFKDWKKGELLVALAGPASNLVVAFLSLIALALLFKMGIFSDGVRLVLSLMVLYKINFAIFNMLPLPPLDGSKVLMVFLPGRYAYKLMSLERYSFIILIAMMMTPVLTGILIPIQRIILGMFNSIIGVFL